jgi:hypothetical protein
MNLRTLAPIGLLLVLGSCGGEKGTPPPRAVTPGDDPAVPVSPTPDTLPADTIMPRDTAQP